MFTCSCKREVQGLVSQGLCVSGFGRAWAPVYGHPEGMSLYFVPDLASKTYLKDLSFRGRKVPPIPLPPLGPKAATSPGIGGRKCSVSSKQGSAFYARLGSYSFQGFTVGRASNTRNGTRGTLILPPPPRVKAQNKGNDSEGCAIILISSHTHTISPLDSGRRRLPFHLSPTNSIHLPPSPSSLTLTPTHQP